VIRSGHETTFAESLRVFAFLFLGIVLLHLSLLPLPYFWDEAGYYIPAAHDLLTTGSLIPFSTPSNAHPPLVMMWLALWWKLAGFSAIVTRLAMLAIAAFALTGIFRLAQRIANFQVAVASTICAGLYPVFFAQSSMAHLDMAAAAFTFWALLAYINDRPIATAIWFSLAVLAKETAILAPMALFFWELAGVVIVPKRLRELLILRLVTRRSIALLAPIIPLSLWYVYHFAHTGFVFGNPEFFRYNVAATTTPLRIFLAFLMRIYQVVGYLNLFVLTLLAAFAMWNAPVRDRGIERPRIALNIQVGFLAVVAAYVLALSVIGGAVLARYMLPVIPLGIIVCVSTLYRRITWWREAVAVVVFAFAIGLFINPPHGFSPEDNLTYSDFIRLHQGAASYIEARYPRARVLTAWPANDELSEPYLGYVTNPVRVIRIEDFTPESLLAARSLPQFDVALVFSTKYDPPNSWFHRWRRWQELKMKFFGYHRDAPPEAAAQILGGRLVFSERRNGEWVGVIEMQQIEDARLALKADYSGSRNSIK
jgi:hypothetical protein